MKPEIVLYDVEYFYDTEVIKHRSPTQIVPRKDDLILFSQDGDSYTSMTFRVEDVLFVIPEDDRELVKVQVMLQEH